MAFLHGYRRLPQTLEILALNGSYDKEICMACNILSYKVQLNFGLY
jgi:hypothetical protein